ncbi:MAG: flagellar biosynthetic protein FliO [Oligoflexales bacterium]|nr:flagellar biosynthetic protein FliO [Oligoflexales bacterium]
MTTLVRTSILFIMMLSVTNAFAAKPKENKAELISIQKVSGEAGKKLSIVTIYLNEKPNWQKIDLEAHGTFLQISLKNTLVPKPGQFYDISSPYFSKMVLIQNESNEAIIRVFTSQEASLIAKATDIDLLNKRIVLTADHSYLNKLLSKDEDKEDKKVSKTVATADKQDHEKKATGPNQPFALDTDSMPSNLIAKKEDNGFQEKLRIAAYFSIAMILLLLLSLTFRRLALNKKLLKPRSNNIPMQALNHLVLAPKQKLSLVQVGHEKLLLSVSPEGISLITHIPEKNKAATSPKTNFGDADKEKMQTIMMRNLGRQQQLKKGDPNPRGITPAQVNPAPRPPAEGASSQPTTQRKTQALQTEPQAPRPKPKAKKKIEYAIDDSGVHQTLKKQRTTPQANTTQKAIDDVTQLIREKLKSLPKI